MKMHGKQGFMAVILFGLVCSFIFIAPDGAAQSQRQGRTGDSLLGDTILGMEVKTTNQNEVGDIEDVFFSRNGKIKAFVVDTSGGFLGMGGKTVAIPRKDLSYNVQQGYAVYQGTEAEIDKLPEIDYRAYGYGYGPGTYPPGYGYYSYYRPYYNPYGTGRYPPSGYYGRGYPYGSEGPGGTGGQTQQQMQPQNQQQMQQGQDRTSEQSQGRTQTGEEPGRGYYQGWSRSNYLSMDGIIGANVRTRRGDSVGDIENLVINSRGRITDVIIDVGGFLGIGSKQVVLPFKKLEHMGPYFVMYSGTEQQLENMPAFNEDEFQQRQQG